MNEVLSAGHIPNVPERYSMLKGTYELHGLIFSSELDMDAPVIPDNSPCDWLVSWGGLSTVGDHPVAGQVLMERWFNDVQGYALTECGPFQVLRFYSTCDFRIFPGERRVEVWLDPRSSRGVASLLLAGTVSACLLMGAGECVLHASAVERGGKAVAFAGNSGTGKSTLAALCCGAGAALITDDTLRVCCEKVTAWCYPGTSDIRLRAGAAVLAEGFASEWVYPTVDERTAVRTARADSKFPLAAIVIPQPCRTASEVELTRLSSGEAILHLHGHSRTLGWLDHGVIKAQFEVLSRIGQRVPVFKAEIPWGPPFSEKIADALFEQLGLALSP